MTVALGLVCSDGVLVASDSMGSSDQTADLSQKVRTFGRCPALWTAAGSVYVMEEVEAALKVFDASGTTEAPMRMFTGPYPAEIRKKLVPAVNKVMRASYANALNVQPADPGGPMAIAFPTDFLMLGYAAGTPWFLEFARDGQVNDHTTRGFYAVGSGGHFATVARALMRHYLTRPIALELGKLVAYRAIDTTIQVSAQGIGPPVQIAVCDDSGARILNDDEIETVRLGVQGWTVQETESLSMSLMDATAAATGDLPQLEPDATEMPEVESAP
jgi:20S proteasome alpha/beta subunit